MSTTATKPASHTPTPKNVRSLPWKVMADPVNAGLHPYHDSRWIATADAEVSFGATLADWALDKGSLICQMRDIPEENAAFIVRACNNYEDFLLTLKLVEGNLEGALSGQLSHRAITRTLKAVKEALKIAKE